MKPTRPRRKPVILNAIKGLGPGGSEELLVSYMRYTDHDQFSHHVAYGVSALDHRLPDLRQLAPVSCFNMVHELSLSWIPSWRRLVNRLEPDIIHLHSPYLAGFARIADPRHQSRRRTVYTEHNRWSHHNPATRLLNRITYSRNDWVIAVSKSVADELPASSVPMTVLIHGIDLEATTRSAIDDPPLRTELKLPRSSSIVLTVANLRRSKDYPTLLNAASLVLKKHPDTVFLLVGIGPEAETIEELRRSLGIEKQVLALGYRNDVPRLLRAADLFVLPSDGEALGLAVLEAMAVGCPVVATRAGGIAEIVDDSSASLVPPRNPGALAHAIDRLLGDAVERRNLAQSASRLLDNYSVKEASKKIDELYLNLLSLRETVEPSE